MSEPLFLIVDLFCGAGGTTTGFAQASIEGNNIAKVIACVNHDPAAIKSHWYNHPEVKHFEEDIRTLDLTELVKYATWWKEKYPHAFLILWASLECTNFSKAKGGLPRDADSRTLADHLCRYIDALQPDYIQIENVVEFMSWGPLDDNGKPVSRKNGSDWMRWRKDICETYCYKDEWKEMNSANYGAYTSRNRLFGCFAKPWLPIVWPLPTHAKNPSKHSMYGDLKRWKAVKEVLNFEDEGISIFGRKKDLSEKTLERIYAGLIKYVAKGDTAFISKYFSGRPKNQSTDQPAGAITCIDHHSLVQPEFLLQTYAANSKGHNTFPVDKPTRTITTRDSTQLVQPEFIANYYGTGGQLSSIENPAPTIPTKDRMSLIKPEYFIDKHFGTAQNQSIHQPAGSILPNDKHRLVECEPFLMPTNYFNGPVSLDKPCPVITASKKHHYIINPSWGGNPGSVNEPCCVVVARQDKAPLYFVQVEQGPVSVAIYEGDSPCTIRIKQFMAVFGLVDIKMRMLRIMELLLIQGLMKKGGKVYHLEGNQSDQKKQIGNAVHPTVPKAWAEAMGMDILEKKKLKVT